MRRIGSCFCLAIALTACGTKKPPPPVIETQEAQIGPDKEDPPSETPEVATTAPPATTAVNDGTAPKPLNTAGGSVGRDAEVTLLDAGKEPRKVAKHAFKTGGKQALMLVSKSRVTGAPVPMPPITMTAPMEIRILEVTGTGDARFSFKAGPFNMGGAPSAGGGLGGMLGGMLGGGPPEKVAGKGLVSPQGLITEFKVEEGARDDQTPIEVGDALPAEAIGVGARWQVKVTLDEKDGPVRQTSTYELISFKGNVLEAKVERVQEPEGGDESSPGGGRSSGTLKFKLGEVYPTGSMSMTKAFKLDLPGLSGSAMKMTSDVDIKRK